MCFKYRYKHVWWNSRFRLEEPYRRWKRFSIVRGLVDQVEQVPTLLLVVFSAYGRSIQLWQPTFPRAGLGHLGKGCIVRDTTTTRLTSLFYPRCNNVYKSLCFAKLGSKMRGSAPLFSPYTRSGYGWKCSPVEFFSHRSGVKLLRLLLILTTQTVTQNTFW